LGRINLKFRTSNENIGTLGNLKVVVVVVVVGGGGVKFMTVFVARRDCGCC
jgi:hypothetical protein